MAINGTKLKANASKHKAMSYDRMVEKEKQLQEEVEKLLAQAAQVDAEEDVKYGKGKRGDELPEELARRESRLKKIAEAKAALEQEAREHAVAKKALVEARLEERRRQEEEQGKKFGGRRPQVPDSEQAKPEPTAQRNFTDPESRIMLDGATKGFVQGYNGQAAVDSQEQIIVAASLTQEANDKKQLAPMLKQVKQNLGRKPEQVTADTGYCSEAAVTDPKIEGVQLLAPPERQKRSGKRETLPGSPDAEPQAATIQQPVSVAETMRERLKTPDGKRVYKMRKAVVDPVFGQIKERRGLRDFLMRGSGESLGGMAAYLLNSQPAEVALGEAAPADRLKQPIKPLPSKI